MLQKQPTNPRKTRMQSRREADYCRFPDRLRSGLGPLRENAESTGKGGPRVTMLEEYVCDLCGCLFLPMNKKNIFCPSCGSSQVNKEMGCNELSDEDVYVGILKGKEKESFLF